MVQFHQDGVSKNPKGKEDAPAKGTAGTNIQSFFMAKRHRLEPEIHDSKEGRQDSPERKRRGDVSSASSISGDCCQYFFAGTLKQPRILLRNRSHSGVEVSRPSMPGKFNCRFRDAYHTQNA